MDGIRKKERLTAMTNERTGDELRGRISSSPLLRPLHLHAQNISHQQTEALPREGQTQTDTSARAGGREGGEGGRDPINQQTK